MAKGTVAVIGAGPSGLPTIKNFIDQGFDVKAFDRCDDVGGNWRFNDATGHSSVFETTHIISSKYTSAYEDYPLPKDAPDYPSHTQLLTYFKGYASEFDLTKHIHFNSIVTKIEPKEKGKWQVTWQTAGEDTTKSELFHAVCIASGHHHTPRWPDYPGQFSGNFLHSHDYKRAKPFADQRVLVIGGGNSACDVAVETSRISKKTVISWRHGYYLLPKFLFGMPLDKFFYFFKDFPRWAQLSGMKLIVNLLQGKNSAIGLPEPDHEILASHPTVNSDLYLALRHGKVLPKGDIERFDGKKVIFKDGDVQEFDSIVACTGFTITHPFLDKTLIDLSTGPVRLYHRMIPEHLPNLYFIGLFQPLGCIWPGAELQAKLAARHLAGLWKIPDELSRLIDHEIAHPDVEQIKSPRHTITVNDLAFRKRLRRAIKDSKPAQPDRKSSGLPSLVLA